MTSPLTIVNLETVIPPGYNIPLSLLGDAKFEPAGSGSSGGWQIVDRPRLVASLQWYDRSPWSLVMDVAIASKTIYGNETSSVEFYCDVLKGWSDKVYGTEQPPIFSVSGPVPGIDLQYAIYKTSFGKAIRDQSAGFRIYQEVNLTLYEYNAPLVAIGGLPSPAQAAQAALNASNASQSYTLYTARSGDTLVTIAARFLNNWTKWTELASLNGIRDPNSLVPGQIIKIPQS